MSMVVTKSWECNLPMILWLNGFMAKKGSSMAQLMKSLCVHASQRVKSVLKIWFGTKEWIPGSLYRMFVTLLQLEMILRAKNRKV